jgi:nitrate reductase gamma subunit
VRFPALSGLGAVLALILIAYVGAGLLGLQTLFGVVIPYVALALFIVGFIYRVVTWAASPVPFHIPTVCGQQRSLSWIKADDKESPYTTVGLIARMALEVLFFRSLFRNDRVELKRPEKLVYGSNRWLWLGGLVFHWSLALILFRHLRFVTEPVLPGIGWVETIDGMFQIGTPTFFLTDIAIMVAVTYLFLRRVLSPQLRTLSLPADYFALFLVGTVVASGVLMRHLFKAEPARIKEMFMGFIAFQPSVPAGLGTAFYVHLFLASVLFAYFPFSKLMHAAGVFLSPTRNLKNDSRAVRHVNPWAYPVKVHTYAEYEDEFREQMKDVELPLERP